MGKDYRRLATGGKMIPIEVCDDYVKSWCEKPNHSKMLSNKEYVDDNSGWHGAKRIKILPPDFVGDDDSVLYFAILEDDSSRHAIRVGSSLTELYVFVPIPARHKATEVQIYANNSDTVIVYEENINVDSYTTLATSSTNTAISIDMESTDTNYLGIQVAVNSTSDYIYGGYVTIEGTY